MSALVSIIIPVYNLEKYIEKCLKSVVTQTYKNLEIICIDDGSTDDSARIIKNFSERDTRIKYVYQSNRGLSATRNEGIRMSTGDYILFIDPDDFLHFEAVERFVQAASDGNAELICSELKYVYNYNIESYSKDSTENFHDISVEDMFYKYKCGYMVNGNMYKRDLISDKRFIESIKNGEDSIFMLRVILCNPRTVFIDDVCYFYLVREDSLSRNTKYNIGMADLIDASSLCYEIAKESGNNTLVSVYLRGIYSTLFEHRIRCKHAECKKEVIRKIKTAGKKYLKDLYNNRDIPHAEKFAVIISFLIPAMYKFFKIIKDPSMLGVYLRGKI